MVGDQEGCQGGKDEGEGQGCRERRAGARARPYYTPYDGLSGAFVYSRGVPLRPPWGGVGAHFYGVC